MAKKNPNLQVVRHPGHQQIVPADHIMVAKLERYLARMPKAHPKRKMYEKQLKELKG